jgi:hypothetical protein|tara:strand:+ start:76 stop:792 length:717 start_codon:yes stop_codon:yes gene_type:complete
MEPSKLKSILFLGDSFTWGQGLHYYHLIENKAWDWEKCSNFLESRERFENLGYEADEYRRINAFPNLVCKELNCRPIIPQQENGGDNPRIIDILENINLYVTDNAIDCIITQFSCPSRINDNERYNFKSIDEIINYQIETINDLSNKLNKPWFGLAWKPQVGNVLNTKYSENHIPIQYKGKEHNSFDIDSMNNFRSLIIGGNDQIRDFHPNLEGHKVIKDSIIHKLTRVRPPFERIGN